jgi:hypothetical protein
VNKVLRCTYGRLRNLAESWVLSWQSTATMTVIWREISMTRMQALLSGSCKRECDGPVIPPAWVSRILVARW